MRGLPLIGLALVSCGPAPYSLGPEEPSTVEVPAPTSMDDATGKDREQGWTPSGLPRTNPFEEHRLWIGDYDCNQGNTRLTLRVLDTHGSHVRAIFDFNHAPTKAAGRFIMAGQIDEGSGRTVLRPGPWIAQPDDYVTVGMSGRVSRDGSLFTGRILGPGCRGFQLRPML